MDKSNISSNSNCQATKVLATKETKTASFSKNGTQLLGTNGFPFCGMALTERGAHISRFYCMTTFLLARFHIELL